jgi:hypothetical protein
MNHWLDDTWQHRRVGETLVESLFEGWRASTEVIGNLCTGGADRWQAAIREIQATVTLADMTVTLADILRSRTST